MALSRFGMYPNNVYPFDVTSPGPDQVRGTSVPNEKGIEKPALTPPSFPPLQPPCPTPPRDMRDVQRR